jgi:prepilin-type processing-associated H-X9-DG protein/prepilin-type N-terminal cleavage/methylation domain-containing protein
MYIWQQKRVGLTLLELLVVIAILAILFGLTATAVQKVRAAAARAACGSNLRQLTLATHNHYSIHNSFPLGRLYIYKINGQPLVSLHSGLSWHSQLLPSLEYGSLWSKILDTHRIDPTGTTVYDHQENAIVPIGVFRCVSDGRQDGTNGYGLEWKLTNFLGVAGTSHQYRNGMMHDDLHIRIPDVEDGTSNTLLIGERPTGPNGMYGAWYAGWGAMHPHMSQMIPVRNQDWWFSSDAVDCPVQSAVFYPGRYDNACDSNHFWSLHPGGANFAYADGSVRFVSYSSSDILRSLATRAGGEIVTVP